MLDFRAQTNKKKGNNLCMNLNVQQFVQSRTHAKRESGELRMNYSRFFFSHGVKERNSIRVMERNWNGVSVMTSIYFRSNSNQELVIPNHFLGNVSLSKKM